MPDDLDWIGDIEFKDLLEKDSALIFEHCGMEVLIKLWLNLPSLTLYISEKPLNEMKRRYIRKTFIKDDPKCNAKSLAVKLGVSERFVYEALSTTDQGDSRQGSLL